MAKHTGSNTAAIAGGTGVASTLVILVIGFTVWYLQVRRRRHWQSRISLGDPDRQDQNSELSQHDEAGEAPTAEVGGADSEAHAEVMRKLSIVERRMQEAMVDRSASDGIIQEMRAMAERVANVEAQLQATTPGEEDVDGESPPAYGSG
uniref:Uncharacterized protein n=1 Tax=Mycena chlorophos TaxID=658473 RepID=A0ABQ0L1I5_MYCCL|nr:predicted protein [Mycena chlorophos]